MMNRKYNSVLFDIDNTLTTLQPTLDLMANALGHQPVMENDIEQYRLSEAYGATRQQELNFWETMEHEMCVISELAQRRVQRMYRKYVHKNTKIHIITARDDRYYDVTLEWLEAQRIPYDVLLCLGKESKVDYMEEHKIEAVFEDNPLFFYELESSRIANKVDSFVIDYPFNRDVPATYRLDRKSGLVIPNQEILQVVNV